MKRNWVWEGEEFPWLTEENNMSDANFACLVLATLAWFVGVSVAWSAKPFPVKIKKDRRNADQ